MTNNDDHDNNNHTNNSNHIDNKHAEAPAIGASYCTPEPENNQIY